MTKDPKMLKPTDLVQELLNSYNAWGDSYKLFLEEVIRRLTLVQSLPTFPDVKFPVGTLVWVATRAMVLGPCEVAAVQLLWHSDADSKVTGYQLKSGLEFPPEDVFSNYDEAWAKVISMIEEERKRYLMFDDSVRVSKFLALILRHKPEVIGIQLDPEGWADLDDLVLKSKGQLTRESITEAVASNNKKRFVVSEDRKRIRACQGHSVDVDLKFQPVEPPKYLYHGSNMNVAGAIQREGIKKMSRQYVHLSEDADTARKVGARKGSPVIFKVYAGNMHYSGFEFYKSENGVWLTDFVPLTFMRGPLV